MKRARFTRAGVLAIAPKAWGVEIDDGGAAGRADRGFSKEGDAAIVEITGPLISRADGSFWSLFCDSYDAIGGRARAAFESGAARVILRINSPGGDAQGCFELARELRAMAREHGKPLVAYADGMAASAAYAIACSADEVVLAPTAYVGSIGVFEPMLDWTAQTAAMGLRVVVVSSGQAKLDRNPDVPINDEAIARVQTQVDQFAGLFFDLVAEMRGVDAKAVASLDGAVFLGTSALGVGLADRVSAWSDLIAARGDTETTTMPKAMTYDEALDAMKKCAEGDDEDAKKAKKALEAFEDGEDPDKDGDKDAKAKAEDDEKKKKDEEAKAKATEEEKKKDEEAKAKAGAETFALARRVQELEAQRAAEISAKAKAELFAKRPDFSPEVRATLDKLPLEQIREAVETWPRAKAAPGSAAAAMTPAVTGGEPGAGNGGGYVPRLTAEEQELLARTRGKPREPNRAKQQGNMLVMPPMPTPEEADARIKELDAELEQLKKEAV